MGILRACFCCLFLASASLAIGACSSDDDGSSGGESCHCDFGDVCSEDSVSCEYVACDSSEEVDVGPGACDQTDVIGSCDCGDGEVDYYRSSYTGDPQQGCEDWCGGVYTAR